MDQRPPLPEHNTEGRRLLVEHFDADASHTQSALAKALGIRQSSVSLWASGRSRPDPHRRTSLRLLIGIPEDAWLTDDERATVAHARAVARSAKKKAA